MSHPASTSAAHAAEPEPSTSSLHATAVKTNAPAVAPLPSRFKIGTNHKKYLDAHDGKWPQMFCKEYPWGVAYPVKGMYWETDPLARLWWTPTYANFIPLADTTLVVGCLSQEKRNELNKVQDVVKNRYMLYKKSKVPERNPHDQGKQIMLIMRNNYNHLDCFPLTWRDIITAVAEFQRSAMECFAYFDYHQVILPSVQTLAFLYPEYNPYWLGAFTCDPGVAETLFRAGVPVWLIRHEDTVTANTSLLAKVVPREPDVVLAMFTDPIQHFARPFPVRYVGASNYECSLACRRFLRQDQMETWQVTPTNAVGTSTAGPSMAGPSSAGTQSAPNRQAKRKQRANQKVPYPPSSNLLTEPQLRDRWVEVDHSLLPPKQNGWAAALQKASRDETCMTHRLPAASGTLPIDWHSALRGWRVSQPNQPSCQPPPMWCMFLNSQLGDTTSMTRAGAKKAEARAFFADALGDVPDGASTWAGDATVGFRGTAVQIASLTDPPLPLLHAVLWELAELSFRSNLLALDKALVPQLWDAPICEAQYLAVFSSEVIGGTWDTPLPQQHQGLFWGALSNPRALDFADAFRLLLSAWPSAPRGIEEPLLVTISQNELQKKVNMLMEFYVQTFFFSTGRPPVVPRGYPGSWVA
ncbi:hypothetical protein PAXINDRAFT_15558 [Paxillus involutus ATCC 200175]|uniref:Uncharacterized protein n=1 Tax=Paxillus involutus ATCC 200175 TaxID=664439 RepID=A0A0C9TW91_PAXIN|nr:hypothetical protein PAXINDRAFT_15558 [Paxillus involutus ATCC 200175]